MKPDYCREDAISTSSIKLSSVDDLLQGFIYEVSSKMLDYEQAKEFCHCRGGQLAHDGIRNGRIRK